MSQSTVSDVAMHLREQAVAYCDANKFPGYLAGVYHGGEQAVTCWHSRGRISLAVSHRQANVCSRLSQRRACKLCRMT